MSFQEGMSVTPLINLFSYFITPVHHVQLEFSFLEFKLLVSYPVRTEIRLLHSSAMFYAQKGCHIFRKLFFRLKNSTSFRNLLIEHVQRSHRTHNPHFLWSLSQASFSLDWGLHDGTQVDLSACPSFRDKYFPLFMAILPRSTLVLIIRHHTCPYSRLSFTFRQCKYNLYMVRSFGISFVSFYFPCSTSQLCLSLFKKHLGNGLINML